MDINTLVSLDDDEFYDSDLIAWIDHRLEDDSIVYEVAEQIQEPLTCNWNEEAELWVNINQREHKFPMDLSSHDRYITISSLAELLKEKYTFWLVKDNLEDDTHGLLVTNNEATLELESHHSDWLQNKLVRLKLGYDYFNGIDVPYLNNENNNPDFKKQKEELANFMHEFHQEMHKERNKSPEMQKIYRNLRLEIGTATLADRWHHYKRYWWVIILLWLIYRFATKS